MPKEHDFKKTVVCARCGCRPEHAAETLCKRAPIEQQRLAATQQADAFYRLSGDIYYRKLR